MLRFFFFFSWIEHETWFWKSDRHERSLFLFCSIMWKCGIPLSQLIIVDVSIDVLGSVFCIKVV